MPTSTFFNLSPDKRQVIIDASRAELARTPVNEISINRIIKAAGIPRGSFYQYFSDKDDLVQYLLEEFHDFVLSSISHLIERGGNDIFDLLTTALDYVIEFGTNPNNSCILKNIFSYIKIGENDAFMSFVRRLQVEIMDSFRGVVDYSQLNADNEQDLHDIFEIVTALFWWTVARIFTDLDKTALVRDAFENKLRLIRCGIVKQEVNQ